MQDPTVILSGAQPDVPVGHQLAATCVSTLRPKRAASRLEWQPVRPNFSLFMTNRVRCSACRLALEARGRGPTQRMYVRLAGDLLAVTEADDLHRPGRSMFATHTLDFGQVTLYLMLTEPPKNVDPERFRPAAGSLILSWEDGRRRLKAIGVAGGLGSTHDCLIDAVEMPD